MRASHSDIKHLLHERGVIARRDHPQLAGALSWLVRQGHLRSVLPGIYSTPDLAHRWSTRVQAAMVWSPDLVLVGPAAAKMTFWPTLRTETVTCAGPHRRAPQPGFAFTQRRIPPELVVHRSSLRLTTPALTALDLCETHGGDAIDHALRMRATTLSLLQAAIEQTRCRDGNPERRRLLLDSRDEPWSAAERVFHGLLRAAQIRGWSSNRAVQIDGSTYFLDVAFRQVKLAIEIDGRLHETDEDLFETDRRRQNKLALDGWLVLRFTWAMLTDNPGYVIDVIQRALELPHLVRSGRV